MKDPTRGGLAACLNEIAKKSGKALYIYESEIPIKKEVLAVSEILGVDPLQTACEGRVVIFAKKDYAEEILERIKKFNKKASIIGEVIKQPKGKVILETVVGGRRFLEAPMESSTQEFVDSILKNKFDQNLFPHHRMEFASKL